MQAVQALGFTPDLIHVLVNKNLVSTITQRSGAIRFVLLETIRHFCLEMLERQAELVDVQATYSEYFVCLAEDAAKGLQTTEGLRWIEQFVTEQDNLHATLRHLLNGQQTALALRLGCALCPFWEMRTMLRDGRQWLIELLQLPNSADYPEQLAPIHSAAGMLAEQLGEFKQANLHLTTALTIAKELGDLRLTSVAYSQLGLALRSQGNYQQALYQHEQAVKLARATGDKAAIVKAIQELAKIHHYMGNDEEAHSLLTESLILARAMDNSFLIMSILIVTGRLARLRGDYVTAHQHLHENLKLSQSIGDGSMIAYTLVELGLLLSQQDYATAQQHFNDGMKLFVKIEHHWGIARTIEFLTIVAFNHQQFTRVCTLAAAAAALRLNTQTAADPPTLMKVEEAVNGAKAALSEQAATAAWEAGEKMSLKEMVDYALGDGN